MSLDWKEDLAEAFVGDRPRRHDVTGSDRDGGIRVVLYEYARYLRWHL